MQNNKECVMLILLFFFFVALINLKNLHFNYFAKTNFNYFSIRCSCICVTRQSRLRCRGRPGFDHGLSSAGKKENRKMSLGFYIIQGNRFESCSFVPMLVLSGRVNELWLLIRQFQCQNH
jgi:hypothetical protein